MSEAVEPGILTTHGSFFRASKRRKVFRRRDTDPSFIAEHQPNREFSEHRADVEALESREAAHPMPANVALDETLPSAVNEVLRKRKAARSRRGGIDFSREKDANLDATQEDDSHALVQREEAPSALVEASQRFAPQTGVVSEKHNRHMMAYVDSQMARLQARNDDPTPNPRITHKTSLQEGRDYKPLPDREPAALGKIHEIDLGPDITSRNIAMTEAATKRLQGDQLDQQAEKIQSQGKMHLSKDGKPRRLRKRRGSDDVRRDEMVDALLRENRLDNIYDEIPESSGAQVDEEDREAADERLAEQFRREFMEQIEERKITKRAQTTSQQAAPGAKARNAVLDNKSKGPKLGGSRSQRAAMHAQRMEGKK